MLPLHHSSWHGCNGRTNECRSEQTGAVLRRITHLRFNSHNYNPLHSIIMGGHTRARALKSDSRYEFLLNRSFLSTVLRTSCLRRAELCFDFMCKGTSGPQLIARATSMAHILLSHTWPRLKELSLNGLFCLGICQKVVSHTEKGVELEWRKISRTRPGPKSWTFSEAVSCVLS